MGEKAVNLIAKKSITPAAFTLMRWSGVIILFIVAYVHIALFLNMMSFRLLPMLFLINGVGALIAMIGVLVNARWLGWIFGIVMSGGAAVAKIAMYTIPGVGALLMGRPSGMNRPNPSMGNAPMRNVPMRNGGAGGMHSVLPLFTDINTLAMISIIIELAFVLLAIYFLVFSKMNHANNGK